MADQAELLEQYRTEKARLIQVERALEIQKAKVNKVVKALLDEFGKGPYALDPEVEAGHLILTRGSTYFFSPAKKK